MKLWKRTPPVYTLSDQKQALAKVMQQGKQPQLRIRYAEPDAERFKLRRQA